MKLVPLGKTGLSVPSLAVGCMRLAGKNSSEMNSFLHTCLDNSAYFFDHADIYGGGQSETIFGEALKGDSSVKREDLIIQTKCGIRNGFFDSSKEHIISSVDNSLKRLGMDYIDILLIHRSDALVEPEEVAEAFDMLHSSGKVRYFGVSNHRPMQIELLKKYVRQDVHINQMQFSIAAAGMIVAGLDVNMETSSACDRDGSVIDYSRINDITIQAWSPFQKPLWKGCFIGADDMPELNKVLNELADKYSASPEAIAAAWILRHPAKMQVVTGTASEDRFSLIAKACDIELTRPEWYSLYLAAERRLP